MRLVMSCTLFCCKPIQIHSSHLLGSVYLIVIYIYIIDEDFIRNLTEKILENDRKQTRNKIKSIHFHAKKIKNSEFIKMPLTKKMQKETFKKNLLYQKNVVLHLFLFYIFCIFVKKRKIKKHE